MPRNCQELAPNTPAQVESGSVSPRKRPLSKLRGKGGGFFFHSNPKAFVHITVPTLSEACNLFLLIYYSTFLTGSVSTLYTYLLTQFRDA